MKHIVNLILFFFFFLLGLGIYFGRSISPPETRSEERNELQKKFERLNQKFTALEHQLDTIKVSRSRILLEKERIDHQKERLETLFAQLKSRLDIQNDSIVSINHENESLRRAINNTAFQFGNCRDTLIFLKKEIEELHGENYALNVEIRRIMKQTGQLEWTVNLDFLIPSFIVILCITALAMRQWVIPI